MPLHPANSQPASKPPTLIRAANIDDLGAILALEQAAAEAAHWSADHYKSRLQSEPQAARFLVAESNDPKEVSGFLCARIIGPVNEWEIENLVVDEKFRRQGIGAQLLGSLIENWEATAATELFLEVRESNTAARALYERHGLREAGRRRSYYRDPSEDAILYARRRRD